MKDGISDELNEQSIAYTSGTGAIFKSGIPIGKINIIEDDKSKRFNVEFYSDFSQLKYVFAEVITKKQVKNLGTETEINDKDQNPMEAKLKILEDELKIIEQSNSKFKNENENLITEINSLNNKIVDFQQEINIQKQTISKFNIDTEELKFLRLNLKHGHKCRKSFLNNKGFIVGTLEYKECVLKKGRVND